MSNRNANRHSAEEALEKNRRSSFAQSFRRGSLANGKLFNRSTTGTEWKPRASVIADDQNKDQAIADASSAESSYLTEMFSAAELRWILLPNSRMRLAWDFFVLALVIYTAITLPLWLSFVDDDFDMPSSLAGLELVMDVLFVLDIILNFNTAIVKDAQLVINKRTIARHYSSKWLPIDAAASVPWEIIFLIVDSVNGGDGRGDGGSDGTGGGGKDGAGGAAALQFVKILKVPKLLRLGRLFKFLERFEGAANVGRIVALVLVMVLLIHWLASVWYLLASRDGAWLATICAVPLTVDDPICRLHLDESDKITQYAFTYYYTMMMIMGDSTTPTDGWEVLFVVLVVICGSCINATIFANVANLVSQMSTEPTAAGVA